MTKFLNNIEQTIANLQGNIAIKQLEDRYGRELRLYRQETKDVYSKVYGKHSGAISDNFVTITGIITGDDFFPSDANYSGAFQEGWLYTSSPEEVKIGDTIEFDAQDGKSRRYEVTFKENLGQTKEVFTKYRLSSRGS